MYFTKIILSATSMLLINLATAQDTTFTVGTDPELLNEVIISEGISQINTSPLRLIDISEKEIAAASPGKTFPELIRNTPGIYSTSETGSCGDAKINIRGFKQENISILLNGIPISGLTSGSMYWNNWMGLADAASSIQVQKGIGGSMLSDNSVGGTVNIITATPSASPSAGAGYYATNYGNQKAYLKLNSGDLGKGWSLNLICSYLFGNSWVECTDVSSFSYLVSVAKQINSKHSLIFTSTGSPEKHEQRSVRLSYSEIEQYGINYNKNWGWQSDENGNQVARTLSKNNYFKPYFTLNHYYNSGNSLKINTALYLAIADGGGYYTESTGKRIISFQKEGQIDWDAVVEYNKSQPTDENGRRAQNIMTDYLAGHTQFGIKSSADLKISERMTFDAGIHYQLYDTWEKERITDLLGADYWYEDYESNSLAGLAGRNPFKKTGDYVRTNNGRTQHYLTLYGMGTCFAGIDKRLIIKVAGSLSGTMLQRWDKYNYIDDIRSKIASGIGGSGKMGILYKVGDHSSLYINGAAYSRVPYSSIYFASGNNTISKAIHNERNYLGEAGYRLIFNHGGLETTFYAAYWKNKAVTSNSFASEDEEPYKYIVSGLDAFHYGGELEAFYKFGRFLHLDLFASLGEWKWKNDVSATIYDQYSGQPLQTINVYADGLHVGDAPQTQVGASFELHPLQSFNMFERYFHSVDLSIGAEWSYNDRYWADFDPVSRTSSEDRSDSYLIPGFHLVNLSFNIEGQLTDSFSAIIFCNINNLFDELYIERSKDGSSHNRETVTGYWGNRRNINFGLRLEF